MDVADLHFFFCGQTHTLMETTDLLGTNIIIETNKMQCIQFTNTYDEAYNINITTWKTIQIEPPDSSRCDVDRTTSAFIRGIWLCRHLSIGILCRCLIN